MTGLLPQRRCRRHSSYRRMFAIIGLGNPGRNYEKTRHNVGFGVIDILAQRWGTRLSQLICSSRVAWTRWNGKKVGLIQPQTFMNHSGQAVACVCAQYQLRPTDCIVVHDDVDMPLGHLRMKRTGGSGGHRGIASLITALGSPDFIRVKLGIGRPAAGLNTADFVLQPFTQAEEAFILPAAQRAASTVECILRDGLERATAACHGAAPTTPAHPAPEEG